MSKKNFCAAFAFLCLCAPCMGQADSLPEQKAAGRYPGGAHIGVAALAVKTSADGSTLLADTGNYDVGFPVGFTFPSSCNSRFDMEFVPGVSRQGGISVLLHPGYLLHSSHDVTMGVRAAFEPLSRVWGFTPLLNKAFPLKKCGALFFEIIVPVRFAEEGNFWSVGLHAGYGF